VNDITTTTFTSSSLADKISWFIETHLAPVY
jgi:hypothetical protein